MKDQHSYQKLDRMRKAVQVLSLLFFIVVPVLNGLGMHAILGTLYSISIGDLEIADPLMVLQTILLTRQVYLPLLLAVILPVLLAFLFGRVFCSWVCPQNTISEWIDAIEKRLFAKKWRRVHHFKRGKNPDPVWFWLILAGSILGMLVSGIPLLSYLSAPGIITSALAQAILGMGVGLEIGFVLIIFLLEAAVFRRYWCKFACPVGAFLSLFRTQKTMRLSFNAAACDCKPGTSPCYTNCPLQLAPKELRNLYPYCFNCGLCIAFCERAGHALAFTFGSDPAGEHEAQNQPAQLLKISRNK